ncbi:MAG: DUF4339 domain-containing protein [Alphaproteobacteria bacterium]|nr:DUF4339 domain-containing protein [Alphaproteobacteria bacterium]
MSETKAETWSVRVGGRSYGPYTAQQMRAFINEGRLTETSMVASGSSEDFRPAGDDATLNALFVASLESTRTIIPGTQQRFGKHDSSSERAHYIIVADMRSGSLAGIEAEISKLGPAFLIAPQVWIVRSDATVNTIRNALVQKLGKLDMLFVVDATHNKAAWFNYGPEADARIRKIWTRQSEPAAAE